MARMRLLLILLALPLLQGCPATVPYRPKTELVAELPAPEAARRLEATLMRSAEPPVTRAEAREGALFFTYLEPVHGPFGIPVDQKPIDQKLTYVALGRFQLYDNHYVYVYGTEEQLLAKFRFEDDQDATSFADLLASFKRRRLFGDNRRPRREYGDWPEPNAKGPE